MKKNYIQLLLFFLSGLLFGQVEIKTKVQPDSAIAGSFGSWHVTLTVEDGEINAGSIIKIQFPNGWHNSPWPEGKLKKYQFEDGSKNHFVSVNVSNSQKAAILEIVREGVDGQHDRYGRSFLIQINDKPVGKGEEIQLVMANTAAPITSELQNIAVAVAKDSASPYIRIKDSPSIRIVAAQPTAMRVIAPSQAVTGRPLKFHVVVLDPYMNAAGYRGTVVFDADSSVRLLQEYHFQPGDNGRKTFEAVFTRPGIFKIKVRGDMNIAPHGISSNPVAVSDTIPANNIYWGDLHSHSANSKDAAGSAETAFSYARDVSALDFYALTDHGAGDMMDTENFFQGIIKSEWQENKKLVDRFCKAGEFITLLAVEWSGRAPSGHHNIFFRENEGEPFGEDSISHIEELWDFLEPGNTFSVPHHTGITWPSGGSPYTDWRLHRNDTLRPAIEIYSLWGAGEFYKNPMSYERYHQRYFSSYDGAVYARDALQFGHYIGMVSGSDDHNAHPGQEHGGLTAVFAPQLTRDSIFDAILNRHTYATTGQRILLGFEINNSIMGSKLFLKEGEKPVLKISVNGTEELDYVQVMKYDNVSWQKIYESFPDAKDLAARIADEDFQGSALYYVRMKQKNHVNNREVRAWSSPIWVTSEKNPWWTEDK